MNHESSKVGGVKVPVWFWIVSTLALLWSLMGGMAFVSQMMMTDAQMAELPAAEQEIYKAIPMWANLAFGIAVFGSAVGSLLLLLRKSLALPVLVISLLGIISQQVYIFGMSDVLSVMGASSAIMPAIVLIIGIGLILLAKMGISKGWLR